MSTSISHQDKSLTTPNFVILLTGVGISLLGDGLFTVTLIWSVLHMYAGSSALGATLIGTSLPGVLLAFVGGAISDKFGRPRTMLIADIGRCIAVAALAVMVHVGDVPLPIFIAAVVAFSTAGALFQPAYAALIPEIVQEKKLHVANSIVATMSQLLVRVVGAALAGLLISRIGASQVLAIDAFSFAGSIAAVLYLMRKLGSLRRSTIELNESAVAALKSHRRVAVTLIVDGVVIFLFWGPYQVQFAHHLTTVLKAPTEVFGEFYSFGGAGAILGSLLFGWIGKNLSSRGIACLLWGLGCPLTMLYGTLSSFAALFAVAFISNVLFTLGNLAFRTEVQKVYKPENLGRVLGLVLTVQSGGAQLSFLASSIIGDTLPIPLLFRVSGGAAGFVALFTAFAILARKKP